MRPIQHKLVKISLKGPSKAAIATVVAATMFSYAEKAQAQIPMSEDFYQSSGTFVGKRTSGNAAPALSSTDLSKASLESCRKRIVGMAALVDKRLFDEVMVETKALKSSVRSSYLGLKTPSKLSSALGVSEADAQSIEATREELAFQLEQLEDFARSNRIIFFNTEDLAQIKIMSNSESPVDTIDVPIQEAKGYISASLENIDQILAKLPGDW